MQKRFLTDAHPALLAARPKEIRCVMVVRNEMLRIPHMLAWHRALGVGRFIVVDNGSDDGTDGYLAAQPDVMLFHTDASYAASRCGVDWINTLLDMYGTGHWCLVLDADELIAYPQYEHRSLHDLCAALDAEGAEAMRFPLLDMYPPGPLADAAPRDGQDLLDVAPMFDRAPYFTERADAQFPPESLWGGVRLRCFYPELLRGRRWRHYKRRLLDHAERTPGLKRIVTSLRDPLPPMLTKVPLVRWRAGMAFQASTHLLNPCVLSTMQGVILHFKFLRDFHARAEEEVARKQHYDMGREYARYLAYLNAHPGVSLCGAVSERFEGSAQLLALGLMRQSGA